MTTTNPFTTNLSTVIARVWDEVLPMMARDDEALRMKDEMREIIKSALLCGDYAEFATIEEIVTAMRDDYAGSIRAIEATNSLAIMRADGRLVERMEPEGGDHTDPE